VNTIKRTILIVDDEPALCETLRDLFEDEGFAVDVAADGHAALAALRTGGPPALVLLDLVMPGMPGGELLDAMRADPRFAAVPVIVSTSYPSQAPPGVPMVRKPVDVNVLVNAVKSLC